MSTKALSLRSMLDKKVQRLSLDVWNGRVKRPAIDRWLANFSGSVAGDPELERTHALYLLSQFIFVREEELRVLIRALYRQHLRYHLIESIRRRHGDTLDGRFIERSLQDALRKCRFVGIGGASGSGAHLLYFFQKESGVDHDCIMTQRELEILMRGVEGPELSAIERVIFIDDVCASGRQAIVTTTALARALKLRFPKLAIDLAVLFGTARGVLKAESSGLFNTVRCVYELDGTFECFAEASRYAPTSRAAAVDWTITEAICRGYGSRLLRSFPLGYGDAQILLAFSYNTPNNTLPIFWSDRLRWYPLFLRYGKKR